MVQVRRDESSELWTTGGEGPTTSHPSMSHDLKAHSNDVSPILIFLLIKHKFEAWKVDLLNWLKADILVASVTVNKHGLLSWSVRLYCVIDLMTELSSSKCLTANLMECKWDCYQNQHRFLRVILDPIFFHFLVEKGIVKVFIIKFGTKILYRQCHSMLPLVKHLIVILSIGTSDNLWVRY